MLSIFTVCSAAKERAEHTVYMLGLWEKRKDTPRELSGGMKRRLMIARALVHDPQLLILDEPTAGVDIEIRRSMWKLLQELNQNGRTIILTTHYLEEAEYLCKNVGIINHKLYLSTTSLLEYFIQPLLIDVEAITKIESDQEPALGKCYKFTIGEPSITKLLLEKEVIDQLEKDYGDLIFSSRTESNTD